MIAVRCVVHGGPADLQIVDLVPARPGPGEVAIRVHAASVNFPDALIIAGKYQVKPELPFTPGMELAGVVTELGPGVTGLREGDRVAATVTWGAFADAATVPAERVIRLMPGVAFEVAAAFPLAYSTAYHALVTRGRIAAGERLLVLGAAGGVGLAAVEIGKAMGASVIAAASSAAKLALCATRGADHLVNYGETPLRESLKAYAGKVDLVIDAVGGDGAESALRCLDWRGRYLVVGFAAGDIPRFPLNLALLAEREILGVYWGEFTRRFPEQRQQVAARLMQWIADGTIRPEISVRFPLADAAVAIAHVGGRQALGKVVLLAAAADRSGV